MNVSYPVLLRPNVGRGSEYEFKKETSKRQNRFKVSYPDFLQPSVGRESGYEFKKHRTNIVPHDKDAKIKLCCDLTLRSF